MCLDLICFILWVPLPQDVVLWWRPCHGVSWWPCSDGSGDVRPIPVSMRCVLAWRTWRALMSRRCGVMLEGEVLVVVINSASSSEEVVDEILLGLSALALEDLELDVLPINPEHSLLASVQATNCRLV